MSVLPPLKSLEKYLATGSPIPLPWVVAHGHNFQKLWKASGDPQTMIGIASFAVPREELVLVAAKLADTASEMPAEARTAIDAARDWANGKRSIVDVKHAARETVEIGTNVFRENAYASSAAFAAGRVGWIAAGKATNVYLHSEKLVEYIVESVTVDRRPSMKRKLARIIRSELGDKVTLGDIVAAAHEARR